MKGDVTMLRLLRTLIPVAFVIGLLFSQALPTFACGSLVAPDGDVRLARATTLVAWHGGVEHYLTSFTYQGNYANIGWIVPLPAIPTSIQAGGAWTLQRLERETHPQPPSAFAGADDTQAASAQVIEQVQVEALNITVIKGSGPEILTWCATNGFYLSADTRAHLLVYAHGSPIFMAAKYDTARAQARHQLQGDGAPVLMTMPTAHLWVPLEVLALEGQPVQADLYLLTDMAVNTSDLGAAIGQSPVDTEVPGAPGFRVAFQERMSPTLYHDLSTDRNMGWVPSNAWLTYLTLDAPEPSVTYDLGVSSAGVIRLAPFGTPPIAVVDGPRVHDLPRWLPQLPIGTPEVALIVALLLGIVGGLVFMIRRRTRPTGPTTFSE
jgi:hypothetical protein